MIKLFCSKHPEEMLDATMTKHGLTVKCLKCGDEKFYPNLKGQPSEVVKKDE